MKNSIKKFFSKVQSGEAEIYNEFSLQHELGLFLRSSFPDKKIQFERNVHYFGMDKKSFWKKEIDISVFTDPKAGRECVIELKYPRNGQVPESMYSFCKDIAFLEQLIQAGFKKAYFVAVADDAPFYSGNGSGIYGLFRSSQPITGVITKPTGAKDSSVTISGLYRANWKSTGGSTKYCIIEVGA